MKKGQAAMEFLMTYGWAILVVIIAIGSLWYFGALNPSTFLPNQCGCEYVNMTAWNKIIENNISYIECVSGESYLDFEEKKIKINTTYRLFYCNDDINELIEVE